MSSLREQKRPSLAVIKLVECIGILLGIPPSKEKSIYKAPTPSNYDHVVHLLDESYGAYITEVSKMTSAVLSNKVANELFAKTLEPGFDYQQAVNDGGLTARDLFNAIQVVMMSLMADKSRIPITRTNILVAVNGTMSSYAALDAATHVFKHGLMTAMALTVEENHDPRLTSMMKSHLHQDLVRRCKLQYKIPDHCYSVESAYVDKISDITATVMDSANINESNLIVYGLEEDATFGEGGDGGVPLWLATAKEVTNTVLLTKKSSRTRPFSAVFIPRTLLVYADDTTDPTALAALFMKTLLYVRPGDSVILCVVVEPSDPRGDGRVERFEMGTRAGLWVNGVDAPANQPTSPGWNDQANQEMSQQMDALLIGSQVEGKYRVECSRSGATTGQTLASVVAEEQIDTVVMRRQAPREVIVESVQSCACSIMIA